MTRTPWLADVFDSPLPGKKLMHCVKPTKDGMERFATRYPLSSDETDFAYRWLGSRLTPIIVQNERHQKKLDADFVVKCRPFSDTEEQLLTSVRCFGIVDGLLVNSTKVEYFGGCDQNIPWSQLSRLAEHTKTFPRLTVLFDRAPYDMLIAVEPDGANWRIDVGDRPQPGQSLANWMTGEHLRLVVRVDESGRRGTVCSLEGVTSVRAAEHFIIALEALRQSYYYNPKVKTIGFDAYLECRLSEKPVKVFVFPDEDKLEGWIKRHAPRVN